MLVEDSSSDEDEEVVPNASATRPRLSNADEDEDDDDDDDVFVDDPNIVRGSGDDVNVRTGRSLRVGQGRIGHSLRT